MSGWFHPGELEVQRRAGVDAVAERVGAANLMPGLTEDFARFLSGQILLFAAGPDRAGRMWAAPVVGPPGFARASSAHDLHLRAALPVGDPLGDALAAGPTPIGLLAIDFDRRVRVRVNGTATRRPDGIAVHVGEAFGNCPKYIQRRTPSGMVPGSDAAPAAPATGAVLNAAQRALVAAADTCIVASRHFERGADASHRGGTPGFLAVAPDGARLAFGDHVGNNMFQTLGNVTVDPAFGMLVLDWQTGTTLQLTGRASVTHDDPRQASWPGAQRMVDVDIDAVLERERGLPVAFDLVEAHRLNPPAPDGYAAPTRGES